MQLMDHDRTSAETTGDAVVRVGSMAVTGILANPNEARKVGRHIADRRAARYARGPDVEGACLGYGSVYGTPDIS